MINKNLKVIILTHYLVYGAPQALREYLVNCKIEYLLFVGHPLQSDTSRSYFETFKNGKLSKRTELKLRSKITFINYITEILLNLFILLKNRKQVDIIFGVDPLNCTVGILMKKLGFAKNLVYYTIDFTPKRFQNRFLNQIYYSLDKICAKFSDETWNVSGRIAKGRERFYGMKESEYNRQRVVPIGVWLKKVKRLPFSKIEKHQLLFLGNLLEKQGVQLVLQAIPKIITKLPDFHFLIIGGGEYEEPLKELASKLGIGSHVTFTGWIKDRNEIDQIMSTSAAAIAMYDKNKDTFTYYADPTKLKDYLSAGLPILLTSLPHNALDIEKERCGIIVSYDADVLAKKIIELLNNENKLIEFRKNAERYIEKYRWEIIFENNINRLLKDKSN